MVVVKELHILNGDAIVDLFAQAQLSGQVLVWREAMVDGPCTANDNDELLDMRAAHLSEAHGTPVLQARRDLAVMHRKLREIHADEVVLWFEDDLFCHVHLWYLLAKLSGGRTTLVCPPAPFAQSESKELVLLYAQRVEVAPNQRGLGVRLWNAFANVDPMPAAQLLRSGELSAWPFSATALQLHLERFPDTQTGLGRIERYLLNAIGEGIDRFGDLFRRFSTEQAGYGFGDAQVWLSLERLARARSPLICVYGLDRTGQPPGPGDLRHARFSITDFGRRCLLGEDNALASLQPRSLGGVIVGPDSPWRWNAEAHRLVLV